MVQKLIDNSYSNFIQKIYPWTKDDAHQEKDSQCRNVTFQVTDDCCCACTYCYQTNKGKRMMSREVAKKAVDLLFDMYDRNEGTFINHNTKSIILDFIGGEPLMNIDIIDFVCTYFMDECIRRNHPWIYTWRASMISNGTHYFNPKVQNFLKKFDGFVSFGITLDGTKEIHDTCRIYHDGTGNFDDAYKAFLYHRDNYDSRPSTKVTLCPENLHHLNKIIKFFVDNNAKLIHANCAFEPEYTIKDAKLFYDELIKMADYLLELNDETTVTLFKEDSFTPQNEEQNSNYCWVAGTPILTAEGYKPIEEIKIGDMVYTEDGTIHPVINTMSHFADNVVEIQTDKGHNLCCTSNHKLFAIHNGAYNTYQVQELTELDNIKTAQLVECNEKNKQVSEIYRTNYWLSLRRRKEAGTI